MKIIRFVIIEGDSSSEEKWGEGQKIKENAQILEKNLAPQAQKGLAGMGRGAAAPFRVLSKGLVG